MSVTFFERAARPQQALKVTPFRDVSLPDGTAWSSFYCCGADYLVRFPGLADFEISGDGLEVQGWPAPGVSEATVEHLHLNQVLPLALSRQGRLVLHGSAVDVDGQGVAFLGISGRGKSTLATSFARAGRPFLTDDVLELRWTGGQYEVLPSHPSVRLWKDSEQALGPLPGKKAPQLDFTDKTRLFAGAEIRYCETPLPLKHIYCLGPGDAVLATIERLKPVDALVALSSHCFILDLDQKDAVAMHFAQLCQLSNLPIHFNLDFARRYDDLPAVREAIVRHLHGPVNP